jgi:hypothetical protein
MAGRTTARVDIMEHDVTRVPEEPESCESFSAVKSVKSLIEWLRAADREYRAAQSIINETHDKI